MTMTDLDLRLDYSNMLAPHVEGGIDPDRLGSDMSARYSGS